jgi:uncharacterized membrane protein YhaH (DUF805 family)
MSNIDKKYLGVSEAIRPYIDTAVAVGVLEEKEIHLVRRKAQEFGDDPDEVEMIVKAEIARERKSNLVQVSAVEEVHKETIEIKPSRSMFVHFWNVLNKYSEFHGRASRSEYWYFTLVSYFIWIVLLIIAGATDDTFLDSFFDTLVILFPLAMWFPFTCVWIRRIHDINQPGWLVLIPIYNFILLFIKGTEGENRYGTDPLETIYKEVYLTEKEEINVEQREKKATIVAKLEIVGGTLFAVAATIHQAISFDLITWKNLDVYIRWMWLIGGILLLVPRFVNLISARNKQ